ncbi:MAG: hexokinase, partial [Bacteroidales bacterium]|nr:hexokinase [Bacteroidales bacterium]
MKSVDDFLVKHKLRASDIDIEELVKVFTEDMIAGLEGKEGALRMIPTYIEAENDFLKDTPVLAIDAGGTNFRAALITVKSSGEVLISDTINYRMPGLGGEISATEFFNTIADYLKPLANKVERIGFCFSYPTEILPDKDGRLIQFCKEVQAPEVEGMVIGKNLLKSLGSPEKRIVLLNDTVATLLAGKSASFGKSYDSYIGFILGTGTNTCYIENNSKILKKPYLDQNKSQIINIESGDFGRPPRQELDILFDNATLNPGSYKFEKMISGGYFGGLSLFVLKTAAKEGIFTEATSRALMDLKDVSTGEVNAFVSGDYANGRILSDIIEHQADIKASKLIIESLIDRASKLVAGSMSAVILKCGKGKSSDKPILITAEG